jgi:hypothetical protein
VQRVTFSATALPVDPGDVSRRAGGAKHLLASKSIDVIQSRDYITNVPSVPEPIVPEPIVPLKTIYGLVAGAVILFLCGCGCGMSRYFKYMAAKEKVRHGDVEETQVSEVWNQQFLNFEMTSTKDARPQSPLRKMHTRESMLAAPADAAPAAPAAPADAAPADAAPTPAEAEPARGPTKARLSNMEENLQKEMHIVFEAIFEKEERLAFFTSKSKLLLSMVNKTFKRELESKKPHRQWRKMIWNGDIIY